jgi:hypothetical protein
MRGAFVLLEQPSGAARPRMALRLATPIFAMFVMLFPLLGFAQESQVFYAIGSDGQSKGSNLYEVDKATLRAVRSVDVGSAQSGMLTGEAHTIVLTDGELGDSTLLRVSAPDLAIKNQLGLGALKVRGIECFDHTFVHPVTGLAYFSCDFGSRGNGFVILDTLKQAVVGDFPHTPLLPAAWPRLSLSRPQFVYAQESRRLYLIGGDVVALDLQNHPIDYILAHDVAAAAGSEVGKIRYSIEKMAVLPEGKLAILVTDSHTPTLVLYDPVGRKLLQHWTETQKYPSVETYTDSQTGKPSERSVQKIAQLHDGPVPSRDGSRLFAMSEGDLILWDSSTLEEIDRFDAPEPSCGTEGCFYPAPDGRGMWFVGKSRKLFRLDDHTGHLIEEVKLPFRLINLIREP